MTYKVEMEHKESGERRVIDVNAVDTLQAKLKGELSLPKWRALHAQSLTTYESMKM